MNSSTNKHISDLPVFTGHLPRLTTAGLPSRGRKVAQTRLAEHKIQRRKPTSRRTLDTRKIANAAKALTELPAQGETWHIVAKGHTPFWAFIPRLIDLAHQPIADLTISTLGFGRDFAEWLLGALKSELIGRVAIACSTYFRATSQGEYKLLAETLQPPNRLAVTRSHAKVIAALMRSGSAYVIEGSGNLRSCRMIEQCTITRDRDLRRFHHEWITDLINGETQKKTS